MKGKKINRTSHEVASFSPIRVFKFSIIFHIWSVLFLIITLNTFSTDFTSSGRTTPNYQSSVPGTPTKPLLVEIIPDTKSETSPTGKRKKLADLLNESFRGEEDLDKPNMEMEIDAYAKMVEKNMQLTSMEGTPLTLQTNSVCSSNLQTPSRESKLDKERKAVKLGNCCLPSLVASLKLHWPEDKKRISHSQGWRLEARRYDAQVGYVRNFLAIGNRYFVHGKFSWLWLPGSYSQLALACGFSYCLWREV